MWYTVCIYIYIHIFRVGTTDIPTPTSTLYLRCHYCKTGSISTKKTKLSNLFKTFHHHSTFATNRITKKNKKSIQPFWWHLFSFVDHVPLRHLFWYETLEVFPMYEYKPKHTIRYHSFITYLKASHWRFRESSVCAILLDESLKLFRIGSGSPRLDMTASCYGDPCVINKQRMFFSKYPYGLWSPLPKLIKTGIHVQGGTNNLNLHLLGAMSVFATKKSSHFGNTSQVHHLLSELLPYWSGKFYSNAHLR